MQSFFVVHIPYDGGNPAQPALLAGQVNFNFDNLETAAASIKAGKLKNLPDVPPVAETLKGLSIDTWWGLMAPAATPPSAVARLNQAFVMALQSDDVKSRFASLFAEPVASSPAQFGAFMKSELAKYERVVKATGAKVD